MDDWQRLKNEIAAKQVRIVALDLPTSHAMVKADSDSFTARMLDAVNGMLLDMLAAVARKDYDDRRRRQGEGIATAKQAGLYKGRAEDIKRNEAIGDMLKAGTSWASIIAATKCSRATLSKLSKRIKATDKLRA